jgi:hypothetical protein
MFRFSIRDVLWLTVVVVVGAAVFVTRSGQENDRQAATHRASEQELEAIRARYRSAKGEFEWHVTRWHSPGSERAFEYRWSVENTCAAVERFAHATKVCNDLETQVKDLTSALELTEYLLSTVLEKHADDLAAVYRLVVLGHDAEASASELAFVPHGHLPWFGFGAMDEAWERFVARYRPERGAEAMGDDSRRSQSPQQAR